MRKEIEDIFYVFAEEQKLRFLPYTFNSPLVLSFELYEKFEKLGLILNKAIHSLVKNYKKYSNKIYLDSRSREVLEICEKFPYSTGTFRTDFLLTAEGGYKIIEMTTRQPMNGYFSSWFIYLIGLDQAKDFLTELRTDELSRFCNYFKDEILKGRNICIIKGNEKLGDFSLYKRIFEQAGYVVNVINIEEIEEKIHLTENALIIEELSVSEVLSLHNQTIELLTSRNMLNDIRNLILIHNKSFFYLLTDKGFLSDSLNSEEIDFLEQFTIPTYLYHLHPDIFEKAKEEKDNWIIKPSNLGKSENVFAGILTEETKWQEIFESNQVEQMILQPFIQQKKFSGNTGTVIQNDYVVGTLLYFNDYFFGPGMFRASSHLITNQRDDRKIAQLSAKYPLTKTKKQNLI